MPLQRDRRTPETTAVRRDGALGARRALVGAAFVGAAAGLGLGVGGFAWALAALVSLPGIYTLASAARPYTAPCPGCGASLGGGLLHLPDDPVLARGATDVRCDACGIYVDGTGAGVREVPFNRALEAPGYEFAVAPGVEAELDWGDRCVACGEPATRALELAKGARGVASGEGASFEATPAVGRVPYCAAHGDGAAPAERRVLVARSRDATVIQFRLYASYRRVLDANRARAEVSVREVAG